MGVREYIYTYTISALRQQLSYTSLTQFPRINSALLPFDSPPIWLSSHIVPSAFSRFLWLYFCLLSSDSPLILLSLLPLRVKASYFHQHVFIQTQMVTYDLMYCNDNIPVYTCIYTCICFGLCTVMSSYIVVMVNYLMESEVNFSRQWYEDHNAWNIAALPYCFQVTKKERKIVGLKVKMPYTGNIW